MDTLYTTQQVKDITGLGRSTVNREALAHGLGTVYGNSRVFTQEDVQKLQQLQAAGLIRDKVGRPRRQPSEPATQPDQA